MRIWQRCDTRCPDTPHGTPDRYRSRIGIGEAVSAWARTCGLPASLYANDPDATYTAESDQRAPRVGNSAFCARTLLQVLRSQSGTFGLSHAGGDFGS